MVSVHPTLYTMSCTVKYPVSVYIWVGFCVVEVPSPKFHSQLVIVPVERSVNSIGVSAHASLGVAVKLAVGFVPTRIPAPTVTVSEQPPAVCVINLMVY